MFRPVFFDGAAADQRNFEAAKMYWGARPVHASGRCRSETCHEIFPHLSLCSKKSPTGPTERTPKPAYLITRSQLTERGPLGFGPIQFLMDV